MTEKEIVEELRKFVNHLDESKLQIHQLKDEFLAPAEFKQKHPVQYLKDHFVCLEYDKTQLRKTIKNLKRRISSLESELKVCMEAFNNG